MNENVNDEEFDSELDDIAKLINDVRTRCNQSESKQHPIPKQISKIVTGGTVQLHRNVATTSRDESTIPPSEYELIRVPSNREEVIQMYDIFVNRREIFEDSHSDIHMGRYAQTDITGLPPSYSSVIKEGRNSLDINRNLRTLEQQQINPFATRIPPPSYAEIDNQWSTRVHPEVDEVLLGPEPVFIWCRQCTAVVLTTTVSERSKFSHFTALALCLCACWPCCLLPYCMDSCKNTFHYCPNCNQLIGVYRPWDVAEEGEHDNEYHPGLIQGDHRFMR